MIKYFSGCPVKYQNITVESSENKNEAPTEEKTTETT
jgi:hypothetical protein